MVSLVDKTSGLHSPQSVIHWAIVSNNIDFIRNSIVDKASPDIFCFGDGLNCFVLAADMYSSSVATNRDAYWHLLDNMLQLDPRGLLARSENGTSLLMHFCNEVDKIERLIALKADVNDEDYEGNSVLKISSHWNLFVEYNSLAFRMLLDSGAKPSPDFLDYLVLELSEGSDHRLEASRALLEIFQHPQTFATTLSTMSKNPLYLLCDINAQSCSFLNGCKSALQNLCLSKSIKEETMAMITNTQIGMGGLTWDILHYIFEMPSKFKLNVVGAFLFRLHLLDMSEANVDVVADCLQIMIGHKMTYTLKEDVVHPLIALLYNICDYSDRVQPEVYEKWTITMSYLLHKCMKKLQGFPFKHNFVIIGTRTEFHYLDVLVLITPLLVTADDYLMECVLALLQLSPVHPFQHIFYFNFFAKFFASPEEKFASIFAPNFVCKILDSCGTLTVAGLDHSILFKTSVFYSCCLDVYFSDEPKQKALEEIKNKTLLFKGDVSSLKLLAIMQIRKTLYRNKKDCSAPLPGAIRSLFSDGILPKCLERDLLFYKPNKNLNF